MKNIRCQKTRTTIPLRPNDANQSLLIARTSCLFEHISGSTDLAGVRVRLPAAAQQHRTGQCGKVLQEEGGLPAHQ